MSEPIRFMVEVKAEDVSKYPDMRLRLLIRQSYMTVTDTGYLNIDEALQILKDEAVYLEGRIRNAK